MRETLLYFIFQKIANETHDDDSKRHNFGDTLTLQSFRVIRCYIT